MRGQGFGALAEDDEDGLGGIFGELVVFELAEGGGEDPGGVAVDEGAEGGLIAVGVSLKQCGIVRGLLFCALDRHPCSACMGPTLQLCPERGVVRHEFWILAIL